MKNVSVSLTNSLLRISWSTVKGYGRNDVAAVGSASNFTNGHLNVWKKAYGSKKKPINLLEIVTITIVQKLAQDFTFIQYCP